MHASTHVFVLTTLVLALTVLLQHLSKLGQARLDPHVSMSNYMVLSPDVCHELPNAFLIAASKSCQAWLA
jgi:hypothetical protein